jgi:protoporphyrinogen IX oxidase
MSGGGLYVWLKALHIVAVIAWMAGLLYLPRLFVYHCRAEAGSVMSETFKVMERRLMSVIMTPAMVASWALGLALVGMLGVEVFRDSHWLSIKLGLVVMLTALHLMLTRHQRAFARDRNGHSERYFRILNEVPTVLMIVIVVMVVVRPV